MGKDGNISEETRRQYTNQAKMEFSDKELTLQFFNDRLLKGKKVPLTPDRMQEILSDSSLLDKHEYAKTALQPTKDMLALIQKYPSPQNIGMLSRVYFAFLEPGDSEEIRQRNMDYIRSLDTVQGRRDLFFRTIDYLNGQDEGIFFERDQEKIPDIVKNHAKQLYLGFVIDSALMSYARSAEMSDVDPEVLQDLAEKKNVYEDGGLLKGLVDFQASNSYPVVGALTEDECLAYTGSQVDKKDETDYEAVKAGALQKNISDKLSVIVCLKDDDYAKTGRMLGEKGLLSGDIVFTDENGERKEHSEAIRALSKGKTIVIHQYADRHDSAGQMHICTLEDGELAVTSEAIARPEKQDPKVSPKMDALLVKLANANAGCREGTYHQNGEEISEQAAVMKLLNGESVELQHYDAVSAYIGSVQTLNLREEKNDPDKWTLNVKDPHVCTYANDISEFIKNQDMQLAELEKMKQLLDQSDPFYVKNGPDFKPMMTALKRVIEFQKNPEKAAAAEPGTLTKLYQRLDDAAKLYVTNKKDKLKRRPDDKRGQLRYDIVSSMRSITSPRHTREMVKQFEASLPRETALQKSAEVKQDNVIGIKC